jgi:hypothetical protein
MKGGENDASFSPSKNNQTWNIPRAPSLEPSIGHQTRQFPIGLQTLDSFQWPSNFEPSIGH